MMEQEPSHKSVALIMGVTGMVGLSLAEALKKPTAPGGPWKVYGAARRSMPSWFSVSSVDHYLAFDATNYDDTCKKVSAFAREVTHVFWVAIQVRECEEANVNVNTAMLKNVLNVLIKSSPSSPLRHVAMQTGTKHYMGPIFDPVLGNRLPHPETPFIEDAPRLPYNNFYYSLEDTLASYAPSFTYSVHRSSIIIGASSRSFYNGLLTLSVYATLCKHEGLAFRYPGTRYTWEHFCDMSDARLLAEQQIWAATSGRANNQAFNCTNGDVFTWKSMWKVLCEVFGLEFVPFVDEAGDLSWVQEMEKKEKIWDTIVGEHGLYETKLNEIACFASANAVFHLKFQHVCSMNKSREFGYFGYVDTLESIKMWVKRLRMMKIIP